jgi:hypothetical protein
MIATRPNGSLKPIPDCYIQTPIWKIFMRILPDISDSKSASYSDEPVIGRSTPLKTYSHSENRSINWTAHFIVCEEDDIDRNYRELRAIQSVVYPRNSFKPFSPPPICGLRCGDLLSKGGFFSNKEICAVLKSYSVKYPTDVPWDERTYLPYKFSVDMTWDVVYESTNLPGQEKILFDYI